MEKPKDEHEKQQLMREIITLELKIIKQGRITNARDEEHLNNLKKLYSLFA
jgi:hypothetical protein